MADALKRTLSAASALIVLVASNADAQRRTPLADLSLQDLLKVEITSVTFKQQPLSRTAAAVYVITASDIERSGATTFPDVLRMVPGISVAEANATAWSVTSRGFGGVFANKLLVLIDGRSVYSEVSGGVNWGMQYPPLYLVKQIEVIRGPGGSIWGANALNGVINIITKSADDLRGTRAAAHAGRYEHGIFDATYGGALEGRARYAASVRYFERGSPGTFGAAERPDFARAFFARTRIDWNAGTSQRFWITATAGRTTREETRALPAPAPSFREVVRTTYTPTIGDMTFSWSARPSGTIENTLVAYYSAATSGYPLIDGSEQSADLNVRHRRSVARRHDVVVGAEYRRSGVSVTDIPVLRFNTSHHVRVQSLTGYAQDEITLRRSLRVTPGVKTENGTSNDIRVLPSLRGVWNPTSNHAVWLSASRGMRRPSQFERHIHWVSAIVPAQEAPLPLAITLDGNPNVRPEILNALEAGYRANLRALTLDATLFHGRYRDLIATSTAAPVLGRELDTDVVRISSRVGNGADAKARGAEASATWTPAPRVQLSTSYSMLHLSFAPYAAPASEVPVPQGGTVPSGQWNGRALFDGPWRSNVTLLLFHAGAIPELEVRPYERVDVRVARPFGAATLTAGARNLFRKAAIEFVDISGTRSMVPRTDVYVELDWGF
jgi:iron complex outermembrane recepter protein